MLRKWNCLSFHLFLFFFTYSFFKEIKNADIVSCKFTGDQCQVTSTTSSIPSAGLLLFFVWALRAFIEPFVRKSWSIVWHVKNFVSLVVSKDSKVVRQIQKNVVRRCFLISNTHQNYPVSDILKSIYGSAYIYSILECRKESVWILTVHVRYTNYSRYTYRNICRW